jgi:hypothetical protein
LLPVDGAKRALAVAAKLSPGIPLPPEATLANTLNLLVDADYPHIPKIHHDRLMIPGKNNLYIPQMLHKQ